MSTSDAFDGLIGNDRIKEFLARSLAKGAIGSSYLFAGPPGIGKSLYAKALAKQLASSHDIFELRPEGKIAMHSIDALRAFQEQVGLKPQQGEWKVFIIHDADRMLQTSSNALLKTFEEPPPKTVIILLSANPQKLLPTILSRCRRVFFQPLTNEEIRSELRKRGLPDGDAALASGSLSEALRIASKGGEPTLDELLRFLASESRRYQDIQKISGLIAEAWERTKLELEEEARLHLNKFSDEQMTATLKEQLEKEISGLVALKFHDEVERLLKVLYGWHRDRALLAAGGDVSLLAFPHHSKNGPAPALERVDQILKTTRLEIERFGNPANCLETCLISLLH
ncbi:MAG: AAA family ATPase [Chlamydiia bacterium]|nr:AAA family ATPase [Chlamydiia bacterium]